MIYSWKFNIILSFRVHIVKENNQILVLNFSSQHYGLGLLISVNKKFFSENFVFLHRKGRKIGHVGKQFHFERQFGIMGTIRE